MVFLGTFDFDSIFCILAICLIRFKEEKEGDRTMPSGVSALLP